MGSQRTAVPFRIVTRVGMNFNSSTETRTALRAEVDDAIVGDTPNCQINVIRTVRVSSGLVFDDGPFDHQKVRISCPRAVESDRNVAREVT